METTVKERLIKFINYKGITVNKFEKLCGLSTGYVANMRVSIQPTKVQNIAQIYPELNTGWLLTGEGEMLRTITPDFCLTQPQEQTAPNWEDIIREKDRIISEQAQHISTLKQSLNINAKVIDVMSETLKRAMVGEELPKHKLNKKAASAG